MNNKMRWVVLSLGHFSRNRYWGEDESKAYRGSLCTSTFIEISGKRLIVDPPVSGKAMAEMLDFRTGLKPEQIDCVYITHYHPDHYIGIGDFPAAELLAAPGDYEEIKRSLMDPQMAHLFPDGQELSRRLRPADEEIIPGVSLLPLPGHTMGLAGALFMAPEGRIAVSGDAVMTPNHFRDRLGYYNSVDFEASAESIDKLKRMADIIVPGHDNYFIVDKVR